LLDAIAPGDRAVWDRYLDERVIHVDDSGGIIAFADRREGHDILWTRTSSSK